MIRFEDIRRVPCGALMENAYLVCPQGRGDAFFVDPGDSLDRLRGALEHSGRKLSAILLTHAHFDHVLAAAPLAAQTGAKVFLHADDEEMLRDPDRMAWDPGICELTPPKDLAVEHYGDALEVCGERLTVLHTPGHSRGSVCLYEPEGGILFSGDTLFCAGYGRTDLYGGSDEAMIRSLRYLLTGLPAETRVLSGHGSDTTIGSEQRRYRL